MCKVAIADRGHIQTNCPRATPLTRREMFFPGWSATVNGIAVPLSQAGLFQSIPVPAGTAVIKFSYAPPHIGLACALALALALAGLGFWIALAARKKGKKALFFKKRSKKTFVPLVFVAWGNAAGLPPPKE